MLELRHVNLARSEWHTLSDLMDEHWASPIKANRYWKMERHSSFSHAIKTWIYYEVTSIVVLITATVGYTRLVLSFPYLLSSTAAILSVRTSRISIQAANNRTFAQREAFARFCYAHFKITFESQDDTETGIRDKAVLLNYYSEVFRSCYVS